MKFSYRWLRELSGTEVSAEEMAEKLTLRSFEVESVRDLSEGLEKVLVGEVLEVSAHPNADRLAIAKVSIGSETLSIVCGAPNLAVGQKVPVALPGAKLPTADGKGLAIGKSKIRGVESCGMICAEDELGLGGEHEGIMVLPAETPVGESLARAIGLDDKVLDIDILPNRAHDCLGHIGPAREICAIFARGKVALFGSEKEKENLPTAGDKLSVKIDTDRCARYTAVLLEEVDNSGQSPTWLVARLRACGLRPINPLVDITNYVMLETGQPLHIFDADSISDEDGVKISVRAARPEEKITLLDGREVSLKEEDLVISSREEAIALAGVMGSAASGASAGTTRAVLEAANFDPVAVRKTRLRHGIDSEAAYRFERRPDPDLVALARRRAVELIGEICRGRVAAAAEEYPEPVEPWEIELSPAETVRLLGREISAAEIAEILRRLEIEVSAGEGENLLCRIPTFRLDLRAPEDLIEEVGRICGYERITPRLPQVKLDSPPVDQDRRFRDDLRDIVRAGGADEIKTYSFYSQATAEALGLDAQKHIRLANPMNPDQALLRRSLTGHLLEAARVNLSFDERNLLFEIGKTYLPRSGKEKDLAEDSPEYSPARERWVLGLVATGRATGGEQFFQLKGILEMIFEALRLFDCRFEPHPGRKGDRFDAVAYHPSRRALIFVGEEIVGAIGEASREQLKHFGIKKARAATAEIDLSVLRRLSKKKVVFRVLDKFPSVSRDLSMIVPAMLLSDEVREKILAVGRDEGRLLREARLFDVYENRKTGERSMAFRLFLAHPERTLTGEEIDRVVSAVIERLEKDLKVKVRGV